MPKDLESRNITTALKGMAIMVVVCVHFASNFAEEFYIRWLTEYAIAVIGIFFVLSGYGIFQSLERRFAEGGSNAKILLRFAFDRAVRIYPLYWLSLLSMPLFLDPLPEYDRLFELNPHSVLIWLGIPLVRYSLLWFITAIIQCYWIAPLCFYLLKKLGVFRFCLGLAVFTLAALFISAIFYLNMFAQFYLPAMGPPLAFLYKGFFFGNIVLFALGMLIAPLVSSYALRFRGRGATAIATAFYFASIYFLRFPNMLFDKSELLLVPVFFIAVMLFCLVAIVNQPKLPFESIFMVLGRHSYTIYLFHYQFLFGLASLGLIKYNTPLSAAAALLLSPALLLICLGIDRLMVYPRHWLERLALPYLATGKTGASQV
ncbi:MAG: acyltransferase family protein [Thermoleophilia bacterium]